MFCLTARLFALKAESSLSFSLDERSFALTTGSCLAFCVAYADVRRYVVLANQNFLECPLTVGCFSTIDFPISTSKSPEISSKLNNG